MVAGAPQLTAAYGLFYLDNRPILLRALEVGGDAPGELLEGATAMGFNAIRCPEPSETLVREAQARGLTVVGREVAGARCVGDLTERPFGVSLQAERSAGEADETHPAALWEAPDCVAALVTVIARGVRGYSVRLREGGFGSPGDDRALRRFNDWLAAHEEELTASVAARDPVTLLEYRPYGAEMDIEGALGVLASVGYSPRLIDLQTADDADLAEYPAAVFPSRGFLELENYGKLVVLTLQGATLVTYPEPVRRMPDGTPFRTTFLWPEKPTSGRPTKGPARQLGFRIQVRDGVSTLLEERLGEAYGGPVYYRLPDGQRRAHHDLVLSLLEEAVARQIALAADLEVEAVARLSPNGGALMFLINRLGAQEGTIGLPLPDALNLKSPVSADVLFVGGGSSAEPAGDGLRVKMAAGDVLILRLG